MPIYTPAPSGLLVPENLLVNTTNVQTLTNKTLTSPVILGAGSTVAATYGYDATNHTLLIGDGTTNNPIHIGHWQSYTPDVGNITLGSGTITGAYCQVGKLVMAKMIFTMAANSAMGTGPQFTLPVTAKEVGGHIFLAEIGDYGTASLLGWSLVGATTAAVVYYPVVSGSLLVLSVITATTPMTWAVNDYIHMSVLYEAA